MNQVIAVYNFKGGVGKTTSSYQLARLWAKKYKVLTIDADPQCNLTNLYKTELKGSVSESESNLYSLIVNFLHDRVPEIRPVKHNSHLHAIPGNYLMIDLESNYQFLEFGQDILKRFLNHVKKNYDIVIIDCPSYFGKTVKYILGNVDQIIIPATPDIFSIKGILEMLKQLKNIPKNKSVHVPGIFFNRYRGDYIYHRKIKALGKRLFKELLIEKSVRTSVKINEVSTDTKQNETLEIPPNVIKDYEILGKMLMQRIKKISESTQESKFNLTSVESAG